MRNSLFAATLFIFGAGVVRAGATFATQTYVGSDTLYDLTNAAISANPIGTTGVNGSGLGNSGDYGGGGSGAGESAMAAASPTQWTSPMTAMMSTPTCSSLVGPSHASGIVIGLDAVDVYSSVFSGATAGCSTQSTAGNNGLGLAYNTTLSYTDNQGNAKTVTFKNWTDVLALLYGGLDKSLTTGSGATQQGYSDCNSPQRRALVASWANLFEANGGTGSSGNTCSTNPSSACTTASYKSGSGNITFGGQLRHAFRRDDSSGTADVFSKVIGLGSLYAKNTTTGDTAGTILTNSSGAAISYSVSSSKLGGYGVTPYCNAMNWDTTAGNEPSSTSHCALGANKQVVGPGGVDQLFCSVGGAACPSGSTTTTVCNSTGVCQTDGVHKRPPPNTWGDASFVASNNNIGYDVVPTSFQDNDPIRRPCIGFSTQTAKPTEEVCNIDNPLGPGNGSGGQLGLVLPLAEVNWITQTGTTHCNGALCPLQAIYPTAKCTTFVNGNEMTAFRCATRSPVFTNLVCPDGAQPNGGCQMPNEPGGTSFCENYGGFWPSGTDLTPNDGRIFNLYAYDGTSAGGPINFPIPGTSVTVPFTGAFTRVHMTEPVWDTSASATPPTLPGGQAQGPCQATDMDDQMGCLTQADACSIGFTGDGAKGWNVHQGRSLAVAGTDALEISQVYASATTVQNSTYPFWRKIYFNSSNGFDAINGTTTFTDKVGATDNGEAELALGQFESNTTSITALLSTFQFFSLAHSPNGGGAQPFCEDFNENTTCSSTTFPTNLNACANNSTSGTFASNPSLNPAVVNAAGSSPIPGDPSSVAANSSTSTVCGNGKVEAYEDCDFSAGSTTCTKTCRTVLP
jgi:hypothetical protein